MTTQKLPWLGVVIVIQAFCYFQFSAKAKIVAALPWRSFLGNCHLVYCHCIHNSAFKCMDGDRETRLTHLSLIYRVWQRFNCGEALCHFVGSMLGPEWQRILCSLYCPFSWRVKMQFKQW
jgi:hypothetical protein